MNYNNIACPIQPSGYSFLALPRMSVFKAFASSISMNFPQELRATEVVLPCGVEVSFRSLILLVLPILCPDISVLL